jgi:integrase
MARTPRDARIDTRTVRLKLREDHDPHWRQIVPGLFIGYRRAVAGSNGAWYARKLEAGRYVKKRVGQADDYADADGEVTLNYTQAVQRVRDVAAGSAAPAPRHYGDVLTLDSIFADYLTARQATPGPSGRVMSAGSAKITEQSWRRYASPTIGKKAVTAMDERALRDWHAGIARLAPMKRGKPQPFDPNDAEQVRARRSTANRVLTMAKAALSHMRDAGALPDQMPDWWTRVKPFRLGDDPIPRMLDQDEIRRLLNASAPDLRDLLTGALMTGGRLGELVRVRVRDYSPEQARLRLQQGKTGKTLLQPLSEEGRAFFDRLTAGKPADALIFLRHDGRPWQKSDHARPMAEAVEAAKVEGVSFKTMRATYGKLLLLATRDLELVAKALGHSDSRITRKHYAQLLPSEVAEGIARMPALGIGDDGKVVKLERRRATK